MDLTNKIINGKVYVELNNKLFLCVIIGWNSDILNQLSNKDKYTLITYPNLIDYIVSGSKDDDKKLDTVLISINLNLDKNKLKINVPYLKLDLVKANKKWKLVQTLYSQRIEIYNEKEWFVS
jgi:hypothetical protein